MSSDIVDEFFAWMRTAHSGVSLTKIQKAFIHFAFDDRDSRYFCWPKGGGRSFTSKLLTQFIERKGGRIPRLRRNDETRRRSE